MKKLMLRSILIVLGFLALGVLIGTCHTASGQSRSCHAGAGAADTHTWIFRAQPSLAPGDTLRAYAPGGQCVGVQAWQAGQSNAVAVKGQVDAQRRLINSGDPLTWRVFRDTLVGGLTPEVYEDTDVGPSPVTYQPGGFTVVSDYRVNISAPSDTTAVQVDLPDRVVTLSEDQDSVLIPLDFDAPYADTLRAFQVHATGTHLRVRADGFVRSVPTDSGRTWQALGGAYPGGQVLGQVEEHSPQLWLPAPTPGDTLTARLSAAHFVGMRGPYRAEWPQGHLVRWTRRLEGDLNADGTVDMADVIEALTRALEPRATAHWLGRALRIYLQIQP
jgi:hypothetical protein